MNILITGGAGYIGSNVAHLLIDNGHQVTIIDNLITGNKNIIPKEAYFLNADISDKKKIYNLLETSRYDLVMHFAGLVKVEESFKLSEKYNLYNVEKAKLFLNYCLDKGLNKIIFSSTAGVYGKSQKTKVNENDVLNPLNPYSKNKLEMEKYLTNLASEDRANCVILRYFNVAGADQKNRSGMMVKSSNNLIKAVSEFALKKRSEFIVNGTDYDTKDGTPIRDFIHVSDLADIHMIVANYLKDEGKSDIFNCGYGDGYSVLDVIKSMEKIIKKKLDYKVGERRSGDIPFSVADSQKFKKKFNWNPKYNNLNYIIESAFNWEKNT
jgi:UDP-glucose 4-epimerase